MTSKKNLDLTHQWPPPPRNIDHMQELKMDDSGSQQCSILLWPAKADSAQLKRWIKKGPNQTSTFFGIFWHWLVPNGFLWCSQYVFPKFPICSKTVPNSPTLCSLSFFFWLKFLSKQACLLAMYVGGPKGKKNSINNSILRISSKCEFGKLPFNNVGE